MLLCLYCLFSFDAFRGKAIFRLWEYVKCNFFFSFECQFLFLENASYFSIKYKNFFVLGMSISTSFSFLFLISLECQLFFSGKVSFPYLYLYLNLKFFFFFGLKGFLHRKLTFDLL